MSVYLVCSKTGGVVEIVEAETFDEAYQDTVGSNNGELVIELTDEDIENINKKSKEV